MSIVKPLIVSSLLALGLLAHSGIVSAQGEVAKDVRDDNRDLDKGVKHDAKEVDKGAKHLDKERHKEDKHVDKEVKKDL